MSRQMRQVLMDVYMDWVNNYLTIEVFSEHNGLRPSEGDRLIELAREVFESDHPDS